MLWVMNDSMPRPSAPWGGWGAKRKPAQNKALCDVAGIPATSHNALFCVGCSAGGMGAMSPFLIGAEELEEGACKQLA